MIDANRMVIKDAGIFRNNFNKSIILKMVPLISTIHTTPNQIIFSEGEIDDDMFIYFIEKGKVEVCRERDNQNNSNICKPMTILGPGNCFGAWSFITNLERKEMVRSIEVTFIHFGN